MNNLLALIWRIYLRLPSFTPPHRPIRSHDIILVHSTPPPRVPHVPANHIQRHHTLCPVFRFFFVLCPFRQHIGRKVILECNTP